MPALQIRDCPQLVYDRLCDSASKARRSISQQMLVLIEHGLDLDERTPSGAAEGHFALQWGAEGTALPSAVEYDSSNYRASLARWRLMGAEERIRARAQALSALRALPSRGVAPDAPDAAELVREIREER